MAKYRVDLTRKTRKLCVESFMQLPPTVTTGDLNDSEFIKKLHAEMNRLGDRYNQEFTEPSEEICNLYQLEAQMRRTIEGLSVHLAVVMAGMEAVEVLMREVTEKRIQTEIAKHEAEGKIKIITEQDMISRNLKSNKPNPVKALSKLLSSMSKEDAAIFLKMHMGSK